MSYAENVAEGRGRRVKLAEDMWKKECPKGRDLHLGPAGAQGPCRQEGPFQRPRTQAQALLATASCLGPTGIPCAGAQDGPMTRSWIF